ncbi:MAG TPA: HD domain-containing protein [Opitutaceae bacterium]|jgi:3'-5' exoribonuclease
MPEAPTLVKDLRGLEPGKAFSSILILRRLGAKTAANGNPYLSAEFGDRTGSFSCTVFSDSPVFEPLKAAGEGAVFRVEGKPESYQGRFSPRLAKAVPLPASELESADVVASLVETSPEDPDALWRDFSAFTDAIGRSELRGTVRNVVEDIGEALRTSPAATAMHHAYRHGLLEHTVHMARAARALLPLYPEVDPDLAMAGILLHDVGKTAEYEGTLVTRRGRRGILQGHVVLGYQIVRKAAIKARLDAERTERLEHVILSHQGRLEWGAAAMAATPEAVFVSMIDNLDAKMGMVQRALRQGSREDEFTERILGLEAPLLLRRPPE